NSTSTNEAAAPYWLVVFDMPKYQPRANLPAINNRAVTPAPTHVSRQRMLASGSHLNMAANSNVNTIRLTAKSIVNGTQVETPCGNHSDIIPAMARKTVVSTSETRSRNETARIIASESNRLTRKFLSPP